MVDKFNDIMEQLVEKIEEVGEVLIVLMPIYLLLQLLRIWL